MMTEKVDKEDWESLTLEQKLNMLRDKVNEITGIIQKIVEDMYVDGDDYEGQEELPISGDVKAPAPREFQEFRYIA